MHRRRRAVFLPASGNGDPGTAKFLPLIGLVVGKLAELFINHEIQASADHIKVGRAAQGHALRRDQANESVPCGLPARADARHQCAPRLHDHRRRRTSSPSPRDCSAEYLPKELARESRDLPQSEWKTSRSR